MCSKFETSFIGERYYDYSRNFKGRVLGIPSVFLQPLAVLCELHLFLPLTCLCAMLRFSPQLIFITFSLHTSVQNVLLVDRLPSASDAVSCICGIQGVVQKISLHEALFTITET